MLTDAIRWVFHVLIVLLLFRAIRGRFFARYPVFYFYLSILFLIALLHYSVRILRPGSYQDFYWGTQLFLAALGYTVIWELYSKALEQYPGTAHMARWVLSAILLLVIVRLAVPLFVHPEVLLADTAGQFERLLRIIQLILITVLLSLLMHYSIPIGRNLQGIILGFGFFLGVNIINLSLQSYFGEPFLRWWTFIAPAASVVTLAIWSATLWSYHPNPEPDTKPKIEQDYELLARQTAHAIARARDSLLRATKP